MSIGKRKKKEIKIVVEAEKPIIHEVVESKPVENPRITQLKKDIYHLEPLSKTDAGSQMLLGKKKAELASLEG